MSTNQKTLARFLSIFTAAFISISAYLVSSENSNTDKVQFTGNEQHDITTENALKYVSNYQSMEGEQLIGAFMGRNIFEKILAQDEAVGIRIYNARHDDGSPTYVIVGVDREGNDLIGGVIGQGPVGCPPVCSGGGLTPYVRAQQIALK